VEPPRHCAACSTTSTPPSPFAASKPQALLVEELRVNGRRRILPTDRVATLEVCAMSGKVERTGIEPVTSGLQSRRSPS
jgi:hypothetical protein